MKNSIKISIGIALVVVLLFAYSFNKQSQPGQYDVFASCLTEEGAKFYGSFQCSHCSTQKEMFGNSIDKINYIECGPLGGPQNAACIQAKITAYPTWIFADGSSQQGVLSFNQLSERTGCKL